jgi:hypothetical protein
MTLLALAAMITGALLGQRFNVLILIPAIALGSTVTIGSGLLLNSSYSSILLATVLAASTLQLGYLGGAIIHFIGYAGPQNQRGIIAAGQGPAR